MHSLGLYGLVVRTRIVMSSIRMSHKTVTNNSSYTCDALGRGLSGARSNQAPCELDQPLHYTIGFLHFAHLLLAAHATQ